MIVTRLQGGMGNQMFQYAFGFQIAKRNSVELILDNMLLQGKTDNPLAVKRNYELEHFGIENRFIDRRFRERFVIANNASLTTKLRHRFYRLTGEYPVLLQKNHECKKDEVYISAKQLCIVGRWQSETFFGSVKDDIRAIYSPSKLKPHVSAKSVVKEMQASISVAVHVRRTDYKSHPVYSEKLGALSKNYYDQAMQLVSSKFDQDESVKFYFISDDIEWCRDNWGESPNAIFVSLPKHDNAHISDFWILTQSDHCIISNSTFGWWGGYLGSEARMIIAPANWAKSEEYVPDRIIPRGWLTIDNTFDSEQTK